MKKYILSILLGILTCGAFAQENVTLFFLNDGSFKGFYDEEIDSISYSHLDLDSIWHNDVVVQEVWLGDSVVRIPVEDIDSICHKVPEPEYKPGVINLDDRYIPYIVSVDGMTITFSPSLPENLRPHEGDVLYYNGISELFPEGFAGKVISVGDVVTCEQADIPDIYDKFVFFGKYTLVKKEQDNSQSYALRRINGRSTKSNNGPSKVVKKAEGADDDDFGIGDGSFPDFNIGTFKEAFEFELKDYHVKIKTSFKETPVFSIEYAYAFNVFQPVMFYKCTKTVDYENNYSIAYALDYNPLKDEDFWNKVGDVDEFKKIDFDLLNDLGIYQLSRDEKDRGTVYFFDKKCPIPECPLIQVGAKVGFFVTPKLEGELVLGATTKGKYESTYIYNLDKNNWLHLSDGWKDYLLPWRFQTGQYLKMGEGHEYPGPRTCETEWYLDGSVKGSIWAGLVASANISAGFGKNAEAKEEATFRIGPYLEGEIKLNIKDGLSEWNRYALLKDSHVKTGVKLGVDFKFSTKFKCDWLGCDVGFEWDQLDWTPKNLLWEKTRYFLPTYEAPLYTVRGNSLTCSANVSRPTFPNTIGFALIDEQGKETRKYMSDTYKNYEADNPFNMTLTFDGLDFVRHRYTIVPTSNLFTVDWLKFDAPTEYQTVALCPDSRHPHLIDLGLPSGTKWLCTNVYADDPKDAGGYYQWGKPAKVHVYSNATYRAPSIATANYQGSEYDAATANLGQPYVTPTLAQFNELFDNCNADIRYSTWGKSAKGVYLKGRNGNNLYLPFSSLKSGTRVNDEFEETGLFLASDAHDAEGNEMHKAFLIREDGRGNVDAQGYGYSVRPVSSESVGLTFEPQEIDYEEVLIANQNLGTVSRSTRVSNTGTSPITMTVQQTVAPFTVAPESLGTFTLQPTASKDIYVAFEPTLIADYNGELIIQYDAGNSCTVSKIPLRGKGIGNGFSLSAATVRLAEGKQAKVEITEGNGDYTLGDYDTDVISAELQESAVLITALTVGSTSLTVQDNASGQKAEVYVVVTKAEGPTPGNTPAGLEAIDLGLPSGTLWANMNVGAERPEDYGLYFAWGETTGYTGDTSDGRSFDWESYKWCNGSWKTLTKYCTNSDYGMVDDKTVLDPEDDAAHVNWGGDWRMPTLNEIQELLGNCYSEWTQVNGVNGRKFTSKTNGNSIFLPAAGYRYISSLYYAGSDGISWSSSLAEGGPYQAYGLCSRSGYANLFCYDRCYGRSVRPVAESLLSTNKVSLKEGETATVQITAGSGDYSLTDYDTSVISARIQDSAVEITALKEGSTKLIVHDNNTDLKADIKITVTKAEGPLPYYDSCPDDNHPHLIDLGLRSDTMWACCNVGATTPEDYGLYFAWGETTGYTGDTGDGRSFDWESYKWCNGSENTLTKYCTNSDNGTVDNKTVLDLEDDAAHVNWGGDWRMPTYTEIRELCDNCTSEWTQVNGVNGRKFTSKTNGNSIFLPAASHRGYSWFDGGGSDGYYWSSSLYKSYPYLANDLSFASNYAGWYDYYRCLGRSVRPVRQN